MHFYKLFIDFELDHSLDAVAGLLAVLNHHPRVVAYNSAILSLGKLCEFHSDSIDVDQVTFLFQRNYAPCGVTIR